MNIQWFPGHMAKTRRLIGENRKLVDVVIELLDARLVLSSQNPEIDELIGNKPKVVVINKSDLADERVTAEWVEYFKARGRTAVAVDSISGKGMNRVFDAVDEMMREKRKRFREKGMLNQTIKLMVVGVPNVGKSSFINRIAKRSTAKVGDRPGVTRGKQWVRVREGYELLDMPGVLWPKFDDEMTGMKLAFTGAVKDEIIDIEELAVNLIKILRTGYAERLIERYKLEDISGLADYEILCEIGRKRGFLMRGGEIDTERAAHILMDEYRGRLLGKISLERPCDFEAGDEQ